MPDQYTTPPKPSLLNPNSPLERLSVDLSLDALGSRLDIDGLLAFQRAANYLAAAQIFLQSNVLLEKGFSQDDIKPRLLGHWGTCAGLNLTYAHASALITRHAEDGDDAQFIYVTGPGHGAPAVLAALYIEGSITRFYSQYTLDRIGLEKFVKSFSWPGGFPSHVNAETPGAIHEGGELGYALAVAYGSVMDKPNLVAIAVIGDGESESGPTAGSWHAGAVLPILHLKYISERTIPGTMDDLELLCLFTGYGYQVRFVEYGELPNTEDQAKRKELELNKSMGVSMEWAYGEIRKIQKAARTGNPIVKPRWPIIILRTPKGMTGPRFLGDKQVVGSFRSHQVPLPLAKTDTSQFEDLQRWLASYNFQDLLVRAPTSAHNEGADPEAFFSKEVVRILPKRVERRMGMIKETYAGYEPLDVPDFKDYVNESGKDASPMKTLGEYLVDVVKRNPTTFRIFSPDELGSNKLDAVFSVTNRQFQWDPETANIGGRVVEVLSEHILQGFVQGYTLTGRTALFPSYEAFLGIVTTMVQQYAKFNKVAVETKWRSDVPSLNYIETSTFSLLTLPHHMVRVYLPPDAATTVCVMAHCLRSKNYVNLVIGSKAETSAYLSIEETERHCVAGATIWKRYSTDEGRNPDVALVGIGVETTAEVIAAAALLRKEGVRVRVINVIDLMILGEYGTHPHALSNESFNGLFGTDTPVVINYHGYPANVKSLLFARDHPISRKRFEVLGYIEQGTTTTPWSMLRMNQAGRFDVAERAIALISTAQPNGLIAAKGNELRAWYMHQNHDMRAVHEKYALEHGVDSPDLKSGAVLHEA
ncbi:hypothetical protein BS47DRAFT_1371333 [Hydnum rufescens UP504]|uniref:Phosphoketolase n=1 Tax=Hydnum rufescens UP504 TaxID=1448309 RepID=A0A9P6B4K6_9AGAM|nr:hypothetical protein BS47DRAFT_1371333 [Hydnum rufescens UP504]